METWVSWDRILIYPNNILSSLIDWNPKQLELEQVIYSKL